MRISDEQRHHTEQRIRTAADALLRGELPPDGKCDITTLAKQAGISRAALYRTYPHLKEQFELRLSQLQAAGTDPDPRDAQITRLKTQNTELKQRLAERDNVVPLFAESNQLHKLIRRFKTDSSGPDDPKDPESTGLFQIFREIADPTATADLEARLRAGTISWKDTKDLVFETLNSFLHKPRELYQDLMADTRQIDQIMLVGAERARPEAIDLLSRVRRAIGRQELIC